MTVVPAGGDQARAQATFAATLVDEWARAGVTDAVIAPGSRSTPLVLALGRDRRLRLHVHLDERSAAFFALGLALESGHPAVVVTTSGTAAVEVHAAVVEAHHANVPLIVCTADRPARLQGVRAPQTIDQDALFAGAVRWKCSPGVAHGRDRGSWRSLAARAVVEAKGHGRGPGPVHLNLAFDEPLLGEPDELPPGRPAGQPWHRSRSWNAPAPDLSDVLSARRGVVVAGWGSEAGAVAELAGKLMWPVLADPRSGCRGLAHSVAAFDPILRHQPFASAHPAEVVLTVGEPPASRVLGEWLAAGADLFAVDPFGTWPDPRRQATELLAALPSADRAEPAPDGWLSAWVEAEAAAQRAIDTCLASRGELTEPAVARVLTEIGDRARLFVSSSMPIRDVEWFGSPGGARILANRGANGIDGVVSTALGVAAVADGPVFALLGDLAFLHDGGGLLGVADRPGSCTFVVVDNSGGGIFSFLPQAESLPAETFERLFATPHGVDIAGLARLHGLPVDTPDSVAELQAVLAKSIGESGHRVVLVRTERDENVRVHEELNAAVAAALDAERDRKKDNRLGMPKLTP